MHFISPFRPVFLIVVGGRSFVKGAARSMQLDRLMPAMAIAYAGLILLILTSGIALLIAYLKTKIQK